MSERRVVVDVPTGPGAGMPLQRRRASLRGPRSSSSLDSPPASRTNAASGLVRAPGVYVGTAPSGCIGGLGARVTRRALGISSVFLQGLRSSGLATVPAPGLERDHTAVEDLGGCLVEYMAKVHALEQVSQELEAQLRMHLESKATRSGGWGALRASWASSCQQVSARAAPRGLAEGWGTPPQHGGQHPPGGTILMTNSTVLSDVPQDCRSTGTHPAVRERHLPAVRA
ncbi:phakinin-like [Carlito syrichta]|uniref:Phakinin-like n=1 Tax=Carlito syrichta TaxID=1868482 RepID=A0A3Q0E1T0_CARSF|nr:phakinin-like [Carlito syrichta]